MTRSAHEFPWNDEHVTALKQHVADGLSSGQVATAMGISRSAAIGKARKLKLTWDRARGESKPKPIGKRPKRRGPPAWHRPRAAELAPATPPESPRAIPPAPNSKPVDLMGLNDRTCRWPLWQASFRHHPDLMEPYVVSLDNADTHAERLTIMRQALRETFTRRYPA